MILSRPVQYTSDIDGYRVLLAALGLVLLAERPDWLVFAAGDGRVALHRVEPGDPLDGGAALGFESDDLDAVVAAFGARARRFLAGGDIPAVVVTDDELEIVVTAPTPGGTAGARGVRALGLWVTPDVPRATAVLERLGLRQEIASDSGGWVQLAADAGLAAVHHGDRVGVQLSFGHDGDVDELAGRARAAGVGADVVDESYGRTLLIARPDGGEPVWVNERQTDLYGYTARR